MSKATEVIFTKEVSDLPKPKGSIGAESTFHTNVVGVSYENKDGVSRQDHIKNYAREGMAVDLRFYLYEDEIACEVNIKGMQIGSLDRVVASELFNFIKKGGFAKVHIDSIGKAYETNLYGVGISIEKYIPKKNDSNKIKANPNLMACKTCGKDMSKTAKSCPHCGESYEKKERKSMGLGTLIVSIIAVAWIAGSISNPTPAPKTPIILTAEQKEQKAEKINLELQNLSDDEIYEKRDKYQELTVLLPADQEYKKQYEYYAGEVKTLEKNIGEKPSASAWDGVPIAVDKYWKMTLKDYDSLKDESCGPLRFSDEGWSSLCKYRAKNSFGGYVIEQSFYRIKHNTVVDTWK